VRLFEREERKLAPGELTPSEKEDLAALVEAAATGSVSFAREAEFEEPLNERRMLLTETSPSFQAPTPKRSKKPPVDEPYVPPNDAHLIQVVRAPWAGTNGRGEACRAPTLAPANVSLRCTASRAAPTSAAPSRKRYAAFPAYWAS
jgi:hypothetical protein